jgi:hypothetical protein
MVVVVLSSEIENGVGGLAVHSVAQRTARSPINVCVQEGEVAVTFSLLGELNALVDAVEVVQEVFQFVGSMWPDDIVT